MDFKGGNDKIVGHLTQVYRYIWLKSEHPDEADWTQQQVEEKYAPLATVRIKRNLEYLDDDGKVLTNAENTEK